MKRQQILFFSLSLFFLLLFLCQSCVVTSEKLEPGEYAVYKSMGKSNPRKQVKTQISATKKSNKQKQAVQSKRKRSSYVKNSTKKQEYANSDEFFELD
jgi:hypothetical protein